MKLMMAVGIGAAISALGSAARADLIVCNHTSNDISSTYAWYRNVCSDQSDCAGGECDDTFGWYNAKAGQCTGVVSGCLNWGGFGPVHEFTFFAIDSVGNYWAGSDASYCTGGDPHCEDQNNLLNHSVFCTNDDDMQTIGYRQVSVGAGCDYTLTLIP